MTLFPRARPSPQQKRARVSKLRTHAFHGSGQAAWDGEELCETCQQAKGRRVHDVQIPDGASEVDARRIGEER